MDLAVTQKSGVFQPGNQPEDTRLVTIFQVILEADQVVRVGTHVFLAQLYHRIRPLAGAGIVKPYGLHRTKAQSVAAATPDFLNRQAAFKIIEVLPIVRLNGFGGDQRVIKTVILIFGEWTVDIVCRAFSIARRHVDLAHVYGVGFNNGADGVVKEEMIAATQARNFTRESI